MIQVAEDQDRILTCYQNRRWDADFLAIRQAVTEGLIGDPFYLETFVGDFQHPCYFRHSHRPISGDALFDWGAHYVDWILNLFPQKTAYVTGTRHKRVWHDVTNADQIGAQIQFADGSEAEFLYSDVAALRKEKWYLLGTEGAITGRWSEVQVRELDPINYVRDERIPVTETPPVLTVRRRHSTGEMAKMQLPLPKPRRNEFLSATVDYTYVISLDSKDATAYYNRGICYANLEMKRNACDDFNKAGKLGLFEAYQVIKDYCEEKNQPKVKPKK